MSALDELFSRFYSRPSERIEAHEDNCSAFTYEHGCDCKASDLVAAARAELAALRSRLALADAVAEAAHELTRWDSDRVIEDSDIGDDLRFDIKRVFTALAAYRASEKKG